jgi:glucose-1-phosphate thymidylyltransferase
VRIIGVIPAAGQATRLQPLPCSKEVLPVHGRPVLDHLVERMRTGGAEELVVVTRPEKHDVSERANALGARVLEVRTRTVTESIEAGLDGLAQDTVVLLGFPDTIWEPADGFRLLVERVAAGAKVVLGLFRTPDLRRSDVVRFDEQGGIAGIAVKPAQPPSDWIWGCAAARRSALQGLAREPDPGRHFDALARRGLVEGIQLSDRWLDIGTKEALQRLTADAEAAVR